MESHSHSQPIRRRRLAAWWGKRRIDALERLGSGLGNRLAQRRIARAEKSAGVRLAPLTKWERISDRSYATYSAGPNSVRLQRLVDLVPAGGRILDIGIGFGYVSGVLIRERAPACYVGVDLRESYLEATRSMLAVNGLPDTGVELEVLDVYEISEEFLARHDPELILLLEVLEHVADPVGALAAIAAAARPGTQLLFTVPLHGRLEGVWGHLSIFDRARLEEICAAAGLRIDRAEPIANHWALIVATVGAGPGPGPGPEPGLDGAGAYSFVVVPTDDPAESYRCERDGAPVSLAPRRAYLEATVALEPDAEQPGEGGFRFPVVDPSILRLDLELDRPQAARSLHVRGINAAGEATLVWTAGRGPGPVRGRRATYLLRPGGNSKDLQAVASDRDGVRWVEVVVELEPGQEVGIKLYRAAYVSGRPRESRTKRRLRAWAGRS